jgi:L-seryl-tRNA(Ser) seleniumtransferase
VGTTNRTHLRDYVNAISPDTAAILVAHYSNYKIIGFTSRPELAELGALARERGLWLLFDQGSGAMLDVGRFGLEPEPTVPDGLAAGCDVVAFSGDKMLGGPQAGILAGRARLSDEVKRHPLARAVRPDKMCLAALTATLRHYVTGRPEQIPVWAMIARSPEHVAVEAEAWAAELRGRGVAAETMVGESRVGGGSLPGSSLPTRLVAVAPAGGSVDDLAARLRAESPPVIGRIQDDRLLLDPRTVLPGQADALLRVVAHCAGSTS